jgi:hypothetical protein
VRLARTACAALAAIHVALFLAVALCRVRYPFDLEWMEGGVLLHSYEMLAGRAVYRAPSADFIAFSYQPLYMAVVAALGKLAGLSLPLARGVSIASTLVLAALVGRATWRETGSRRYAWLAAATVPALFRVTGFWFDLARVDSLFLALTVGAIYGAKYVERPWRACVASAVLFVLAYKTKQLALPFFALAPAALWARSRRAALAFVPLALAPLGLDAWWMGRATDGWFSFYVNVVPAGQPIEPGRLAAFLPFVARDVPWLAVLAAIGTYARLKGRSWSQRASETWSLALLVGIVATLAAWARPGGWSNNFMTTYVLAIVPAYVEMHRLEPLLAPRWQAGLWSALAAQLALLGYDPRAQIPTRDDYDAGELLVARMRDAPGPVLVPERPWLAVLAGKAPGYHSSGFWEISFQPRAGQDFVPADLRDRLAAGYYTLVVMGANPESAREASRWFPGELPARYRCDEPLHLPGRGLAPFTGIDNTPRWACTRR